MGPVNGVYGVIYRGMHNGKLRVGWMVAGCAPERTMTRSVLFHCTTWLTGFVPCAVAGARLAAASKATAVPAINRVFISVLHHADFGLSLSRSDPAAAIRGVIAFR